MVGLDDRGTTANYNSAATFLPALPFPPFHAHPFYAVLHALVDLHGGGEDTLTYGENESSSSARRPILLLLLLCSV